jgi:hypothetical protein
LPFPPLQFSLSLLLINSDTFTLALNRSGPDVTKFDSSFLRRSQEKCPTSSEWRSEATFLQLNGSVFREASSYKTKFCSRSCKVRPKLGRY